MPSSVTWDDYRRAETFLPVNAKRLVYNTDVKVHWIDESSRFWYVRQSDAGKTFVVVDATVYPPKVRPAFDHARLASALSTQSGKRCVAGALPFDRLERVDGSTVEFDFDGKRWQCNTETYDCRPVGDAPLPHETPSPDGRRYVFVKDDNLYVRSDDGGGVKALTTDGEEHYGYGTCPHRKRKITDRQLGFQPPAMALWSPDSTKIVTHRLDERTVGEMHLIQSIPGDGSRRPVLHSYKYALVGDEHVPTVELVIIDVNEGTVTPVEHDVLLALTHSPLETDARRVWWNEQSTKVYFVREERGFKAAELWEVDAATGKGRVVLREESDTFIQAGPGRADGPLEAFAVVSSRDEVLWWSERDGWGHLYRYGTDGTLKNQVTRGEWVVHKIHYVDEEEGVVYFTAGGREPGRDPYYSHLYRVHLDGDNLDLLTPEDAHHVIQFCPAGTGFVDTYSRIDQPPKTIWRAADGTFGSVLEEADVSRLLAEGWRWPEAFSVKASDGVTDLYGALFFPPDFDPSEKYPVLDNIYPGPQWTRTPKAFTLDEAQSFAALGFIVFVIDGPGTPLRSKAFHDAAYGRGFAEAGSLGEHVAALRKLGRERPYMDLDRVGIFGHSGGGMATAKALFTYPDFFKVGVSSAGNHDQRGYRTGWAERYIGFPDEGDDGRWDVQANAPLVDNLKGKLFLSFGELDDNVHPSMTIELVDALIRANKDFDLLILPFQNHGYDRLEDRTADGAPDLPGDPYFIRKRWDYFVEHLLGQKPIQGYRLEMHKRS